MSDHLLAALQHDLQIVKSDLGRFAEFYDDVRYSYYHADPSNIVSDEVWRFVAENHGWSFDDLEVFPGRWACLAWGDESFAATKFKTLCAQCSQVIFEHAGILREVPEASPLLDLPCDHYQWIRLVHEVAATNPVWSGLINRCLIVSQRPFDETRRERVVEWDESGKVEPNKAEMQLVRRLSEAGENVPDIWFEFIPTSQHVAHFHRQMLDLLEELIEMGQEADLVRGLTDLQAKLVISLGRETLSTNQLCGKLSDDTGKVYGMSGHTKGALSELVKRGVMNNVGKGYSLSKLGQRILQQLSHRNGRGGTT